MQVMCAEHKPRRRVRADLLLIAALLLVSLAVGLFAFVLPARGDTVEVRVDGVFYGAWPLGEDIEVEIVSKAGHNTLVIRHGEAFVRAADCPDGICAAHRPITKDGESIICLPHRVVITVRQMGEDAADATV